jgi:HK97 gp10 family phage protein
MAKIEVFGLEDVIADFRDMDKESRKKSVAAVRRATNKLKNAIKQAAPEDKGILKKSIKANVRTYDQRKFASGAVVIDSPGAHWIPVEFGHSWGIDGKPVPPHPFVYPTRDKLLPEILDSIENEVLSVIK